MPDTTHIHWRLDRPTEGFYTTQVPAHPDRPVRTFLPSDYQPRYAYPLVVLFHGNGGSEESVGRLAPRLSRRNYISICLRGPRNLGSRPAEEDKTWTECPRRANSLALFHVSVPIPPRAVSGGSA